MKLNILLIPSSISPRYQSYHHSTKIPRNKFGQKPGIDLGEQNGLSRSGPSPSTHAFSGNKLVRLLLFHLEEDWAWRTVAAEANGDSISTVMVAQGKNK